MHNTPLPGSQKLVAELLRIVGHTHLLTAPQQTARYRTGFRSGQGDALAVFAVRLDTFVSDKAQQVFSFISAISAPTKCRCSSRSKAGLTRY